MRCPARPPRRPAPQRLWVWALLCALLMQGHASAVLRLLGPSHHHRAPAMPTGPAPAGPADALPSLLHRAADTLRQLRAAAAAHAHGHAGGLFVPAHHLDHDHGHHHGHAERHHHDPGDETVVAQAGSDAAASGLDEGAGGATAGSLTAPSGLGPGLACPGSAGDQRPWPRAGAEGFQDFLGDLPAPPPRG